MIVIVKRITIHVQSFFCVCVCMPEQIEAVNCKYDKLQHKFISFSFGDPLYFRGQITSVAVFLFHIPHTSETAVSFQGSKFLQVFNEFPSLICWCAVIHNHRPQGPTLFQGVRSDFVQCNVCTDTGPPILSSIREDQILCS